MRRGAVKAIGEYNYFTAVRGVNDVAKPVAQADEGARVLGGGGHLIQRER
jgi:hypothetical protein